MIFRRAAYSRPRKNPSELNITDLEDSLLLKVTADLPTLAAAKVRNIACSGSYFLLRKMKNYVVAGVVSWRGFLAVRTFRISSRCKKWMGQERGLERCSRT